MIEASIILAIATVGRSAFLNSYTLHCIATYFSQNIQSAAPPAIVPRRKSLISMTFLTLFEEMKAPIVALASTATNTPSLNSKARVVVPFAKSVSFGAFSFRDFMNPTY
jgi:hypothetical protein